MQRAAKTEALNQIFSRQSSAPAAGIDEEESNSDEELSVNSINDIDEEQFHSPTSTCSDEEIMPITFARQGQSPVLVSPLGQQWTRTPPGSRQRQSRNILRVQPARNNTLCCCKSS